MQTIISILQIKISKSDDCKNEMKKCRVKGLNGNGMKRNLTNGEAQIESIFFLIKNNPKDL